MERLNAVIATGEVSRSGLARAAGLHPNSLRKLGSPVQAGSRLDPSRSSSVARSKRCVT